MSPRCSSGRLACVIPNFTSLISHPTPIPFQNLASFFDVFPAFRPDNAGGSFLVQFWPHRQQTSLDTRPNETTPHSTFREPKGQNTSNRTLGCPILKAIFLCVSLGDRYHVRAELSSSTTCEAHTTQGRTRHPLSMRTMRHTPHSTRTIIHEHLATLKCEQSRSTVSMHIVKEETGKRPQPTTWPNT